MVPSTLVHRDLRGFAEPDAFRPARRRAGRPVPLAAEPERMVQRATVLVPRRGLLARVG